MGVKRIFVCLFFRLFFLSPGLQKENGHVNWYVGTEGNGISIFPHFPEIFYQCWQGLHALNLNTEISSAVQKLICMLNI